MSLEIEPVSRPTSEAASLISELDDVLGALYEPEQRHGYSIEPGLICCSSETPLGM